MKAAICYEFNQPLVVDELEMAPPQWGEVVVQLSACAVCHSDIHWFSGDFRGDLPRVCGHEAAGEVVELGPGVTQLRGGERGAVSLLRSCGRCHYCVKGAPHLCIHDFALNTETRLKDRAGLGVQHGTKVAGFAEYCIVDQSQVVPLPAEIPMDRACLLACGVITGLGAVQNTAQLRPGESAVVIGCGGVGVNAIQGAALAGASRVIAVDLLPTKREEALGFGATDALDGAQKDLPDAVRDLTDGLGADYVFVTVGSVPAIESAFSLIRKGGAVVVVGLPGYEAARFSARRLIDVEGRILMSWMGSTRLAVDVPRLAQLYLDGKLDLDSLITKRYPLAEINDAITHTVSGQALRNVITF
ncbi:MAG: zinc-binding dehydrogenase [Anaerolineaceae bacterium]|nr:zinc-binding dehydrogenase [Anaerolineaceae bacterium]